MACRLGRSCSTACWPTRRPSMGCPPPSARQAEGGRHALGSVCALLQKAALYAVHTQLRLQGCGPLGCPALPTIAAQGGSSPVPSTPALLVQMHSALLRWITGDPSAGIAATSHPLPVLPHEQDMRITEAAGGRQHAAPLLPAKQPYPALAHRAALHCRARTSWHLTRPAPATAAAFSSQPPLLSAGELLLVMCLVLAASVLSASFAVFLVRCAPAACRAVRVLPQVPRLLPRLHRAALLLHCTFFLLPCQFLPCPAPQHTPAPCRERASGSKAVQRVAGVRASAFWAANLLFDLALFSVSRTASGCWALFVCVAPSCTAWLTPLVGCRAPG